MITCVMKWNSLLFFSTVYLEYSYLSSMWMHLSIIFWNGFFTFWTKEAILNIKSVSGYHSSLYVRCFCTMSSGLFTVVAAFMVVLPIPHILEDKRRLPMTTRSKCMVFDIWTISSTGSFPRISKMIFFINPAALHAVVISSTNSIKSSCVSACRRIVQRGNLIF